MEAVDISYILDMGSEYYQLIIHHDTPSLNEVDDMVVAVNLWSNRSSRMSDILIRLYHQSIMVNEID